MEHLLHALASCLTTSVVAHAAVRGIRIEALESHLEGEIDMRGFLGRADDVPKGYTAIRAAFRVQADPEDLPRIRELAAFSPVFNTLAQGTRVDVEVASMNDCCKAGATGAAARSGPVMGGGGRCVSTPGQLWWERAVGTLPWQRLVVFRKRD